MKNLIVTIIGGQTIPNVQFIKEMPSKESKYLFVYTEQTLEQLLAIKRVCNLSSDGIIEKEVEAYSYVDVEKKLSSISYDAFDKIKINVTGGTKVMSLSVFDFFKRKRNAEIFYVISGKEYAQIYPTEEKECFQTTITVDEYFISCGIEPYYSTIEIDKEYTLSFIDRYLKFGKEDIDIIEKLRIDCRNKKRGCSLSEMAGIRSFLKRIEFPMNDPEKLSKNEVRFLTGEWYELWCYYTFKDRYAISDECIKTGVQILNSRGIPNELDVVYTHQGNLHVIECKTSIESDEQDLLANTIYKQAALKKDFGIFSQISIYTLSTKQQGEVKESHIKRAEDFNIVLKCREELLSEIS